MLLTNVRWVLCSMQSFRIQVSSTGCLWHLVEQQFSTGLILPFRGPLEVSGDILVATLASGDAIGIS